MHKDLYILAQIGILIFLLKGKGSSQIRRDRKWNGGCQELGEGEMRVVFQGAQSFSWADNDDGGRVM